MTALQALAHIRAKGYEVQGTFAGRAVGTEVYKQRVLGKLDELGLQDVVDAPGQIDDIQSFLLGSDIGVQTSRSEGLSMALLEQMMAGLAIVATDVGDTAEALDHGRCGLLIEPGDLEGLTAALEQLIRDPKLRQRLGRAARERAVEHYSLDAMAKRAMAVYESCLNGRVR